MARQRPTTYQNKRAHASRRVSCLNHKNQFARADSLASSLGVANATPDTLKSLLHLFPGLKGVTYGDLLELYDPAPPPLTDASLIFVNLDSLKICLANAPVPDLLKKVIRSPLRESGPGGCVGKGSGTEEMKTLEELDLKWEF